MENKEVLPLGSVVVLKEGIQKLLIVGRGAIYNDAESNGERFADYVGVLYPTGLDPEVTVFFQSENIDEVLFKGYSDQDEKRFIEIYKVWEKETLLKYKKA